MVVMEQRENDLLIYLSRQRDFTTAEELAHVLTTSVKTIYRLIKKINDYAKDERLICAEKGKGYKLNYEKYILMSRDCVNKISNFSPIERRNTIMEELLLRAPKSIEINDLFEKYYVSDAVISHDEKVMCEILKKYNLVYERKHKRACIMGTEINIRKAISNIVTAINTIDVEELKKNVNLSLNSFDVVFVLDLLRFIEFEIHTEIPHPYSINIFSHLYIMIGRIRKSGNVFRSVLNFPSSKEENIIKENPSMYCVSDKVIKKVEKYIHMTLPQEETYYLFQYLLSLRIKEEKEERCFITPLVKEITDVYLQYLGSIISIKKNRHAIYMDLSQHIKPMINRLQHNIGVKNNLLGPIKSEYTVIFRKVQEASKIVSEQYNLPLINDDESGFITLFFARMLEQNSKFIKTVIMCTTGVGTSELLKVKVKKKFPELDIIAVISSRDTLKIRKEYPEIELILTTVKLSQELQIPTLLVSAMFTFVDQERVQNKIEEFRNAN